MLFKNLIVLVIVKMALSQYVNTTECPNTKISLDLMRKRRFLTFPDNSAVVLTISLVKAFMVHAPSGWNIALEIDVFFPLPDAAFTNKHFRKKLHSRHKREFWDRLKNAFEIHNIDGRTCVLKSICEAKTSLAPPGRSLVHDLLRSVFTYTIKNDEEELKNHYHELLDPNFCEIKNDCPLSILDFVLSLNKQSY